MIPVSEIQRVIAKLERASRVSMTLKKYDKADAYNAAIILLKELIPSEPNNPSERIPSNTERA